MHKKPVGLRLTAAALGGLMLAGVTTAAFADEQQGSDDVDVNVEIAPVDGPGALTMTVAASETALSEVPSDAPGVREFVGQLPSVTVTDTRETIPEGAAWAVVGQASDFTSQDGGGQADITADHLGWAPSVVDPGETYEVLPGDVVGTVLDPDLAPNDVGLVDQELLAMTLTGSAESQNVAESWTADAELTLKVPASVEPGSYSSLLTLSLFE